MLIEFKKAFGITSVPWEFLTLSTQLASHGFPVKLDGVVYTIRLGSFGTTREERLKLAGFLYSDERNSFLEHSFKLSTLDVVFERNLPDNLSTRMLEGKLKALRPLAHAALECFIRAWMQTEKNRHRVISEDEMFAIIRRIPRISLAEFQNLLFYRAHTAAGLRIGFLGEGSTIISAPIPDSVRKDIVYKLQFGSSQFDERLLNAWLSYYDEDYPSSLLNAAFACEILTKSFLRNQLNQNETSPKSNEQFVRWLSMRDMFRVVLPLYLKQKQHRSLLVSCVKIFHDRNNVAHGIKNHVGRDEAWYALSRTEELVRLLR